MVSAALRPCRQQLQLVLEWLREWKGGAPCNIVWRLWLRVYCSAQFRAESAGICRTSRHRSATVHRRILTLIVTEVARLWTEISFPAYDGNGSTRLLVREVFTFITLLSV